MTKMARLTVEDRLLVKALRIEKDWSVVLKEGNICVLFWGGEGYFTPMPPLYFVEIQRLHAHGVGVCGYGYIHGHPRKIRGYGYGWEISYPRQACNFPYPTSVIKFHVAQPMWSGITNVTDRWTDVKRWQYRYMLWHGMVKSNSQSWAKLCQV